MIPTEFHFLRPAWLLALLPALLVLLAVWRSSAGTRAWERLVDPHLLRHLLRDPDPQGRSFPFWLLGLGWTLIVLALAGPTWERVHQPVFTSDAARVLMLDLSPSMDVIDTNPSRLARARFEVMDLLSAAQDGQTALLAFGPEPFIVSPLTRDARTIASQVPQLSTDLVPLAGPRDTGRALQAANELLQGAGARNADLILLTDGIGGIAGAYAQARALARAGHRLSVLAVGTVVGGPVPTAGGGFASDGSGGRRIARLQEEELRELARLGGGRYVEARIDDADTRLLLDIGSRRAGVAEESDLSSDQWREEGPWLLLVLLPLAALAFRRGWILPVLVVLAVLPSHPALALSWSDLWWRADQQGDRALRAGDPDRAARLFRDGSWSATANYRAGDYEGALAALSGAGGVETDYNRGNALARLGRFDEALAYYERVLAAHPDHEDARFNLELLRSLQDAQGESGSTQAGQADQRAADGGQRADAGTSNQGADADQGDPGMDADDGATADVTSSRDAGTGSSDRDPAGAGRGAPSDAAPGQVGDSGGGDTEPLDSAATAPRSDDAAALGQAAQDSETLAWPSESEEGSSGERAAHLGSRDSADPGPDAAALSERPGAEEDVEGLDPHAREREQAMEAQLRRIPDDPGGLLRQRFLLQHLRREGRLP